MPAKRLVRDSPRVKAVKKIESIIKTHQEYEKRYDPSLDLFAKASKEKVNKGIILKEKIIKGMKTKQGKYTMKELMARAKPWAERIMTNRNFLHSYLPAHQRAAIEKLASGKTVTRNEMESIKDAVREYRGVIHGETQYLRR